MVVKWKTEYDDLVEKLIEKHFSGPSGIAERFPCMRGLYPWGSHRPDVIDSRVPAKNNTEYHGLEELAKQYHITAQYEYSYHHWLIASSWRRQDVIENDLSDQGHESAIDFCLKQAIYNEALHSWQTHSPNAAAPQPEEFGLNSKDIELKDKEALKRIEECISDEKQL